MNIEAIITHTQNAILESKKDFNQIPKDSIMKFLKQSGVQNETMRESIYDRLKELNKKKTATTKVSETQVVSQNKKEPRKTIFGQIKRVA